MELDHKKYMNEACKLAELSVTRGTGPFGCVVVQKSTGEIFGKGHNMVTMRNDPSLHAEIVAISDACHNLKNFQLTDCVLYTSCEPCPMCLAAIYWSRIDAVYYGNTKTDAAKIGFDDKFIYEEFAKPIEERKIKMTQICSEVANIAFKEWVDKSDKVPY
jgi:pyrimidine deaminase RibD-like protein